MPSISTSVAIVPVLVLALCCGTGGAAPSPAFAASAGAAPYRELGAPSDAYAGEAPKGWVMLVHRGAWEGVGRGAVERLRPEARRFSDQGWSTLSVSYRPGAAGLTDVKAFYDRLRARVGAYRPVCLYGQSAGGQLVLMTAQARPSARCVIVEGAPTDLPALAHQTAFNPATGGQQSAGPRYSFAKATQAFGAENLSSYSPLTGAARLRATTLMATATTDALVPRAQMDALRTVRPDKVTTMRLAGASRARGRSAFTHAYITSAARRSWEAAKRRLLLSAGRRAATADRAR